MLWKSSSLFWQNPQKPKIYGKILAGARESIYYQRNYSTKKSQGEPLRSYWMLLDTFRLLKKIRTSKLDTEPLMTPIQSYESHSTIKQSKIAHHLQCAKQAASVLNVFDAVRTIKHPASSSWSQPTSKRPVKSDHLKKQGQTKYLKPPWALQYCSYSISKHSHILKDPPPTPNLQWLPLFLLRHMYFSQYLAARSGSGPKHLGNTSTIVSCSWGKKCLIRDWQGVGEESAIEKQ